MDYLVDLVLLLIGITNVVAASDLCPYRARESFFETSIKFKYCRAGCCGRSEVNVCCSGPPIDLVIGCVAGAAVLIILVMLITCCICARSRLTSRGTVVRRTLIPARIFHTAGTTNPALSPDAPDMFQPPPYEVVTSGQEKPPSYDEVMRTAPEQPTTSAQDK